MLVDDSILNSIYRSICACLRAHISEDGNSGERVVDDSNQHAIPVS